MIWDGPFCQEGENMPEKIRDKDIREPLFVFLEETFGKCRILEEKRTGGSRADVVMITPEEIWGIEIKSDADNYSRLASQVESYDAFYDRNYLVIGTSHAGHAQEHVPDWWGLITVEWDEKGEMDFYLLRKAQINPRALAVNKISLLWRPELNHILDKTGQPAYRYKSKAAVADILLERIPPEQLWPLVCEELLERDYNTIRDQINAYRKEHGKRARRKRKYTRVKKPKA